MNQSYQEYAGLYYKLSLRILEYYDIVQVEAIKHKLRIILEIIS